MAILHTARTVQERWLEVAWLAQPLTTIIWTNLKVPDIRIGEERVFFVWVEQGEVFHDDGDEQIQHDVGDDHVEAVMEGMA